MSITKYTNFEEIDSRKENKGNFLLKDDLFIVSKTEIEEADFGDCKHDVMEVSIYDVNNVLLPNKTGNNVAYIKPNDMKKRILSNGIVFDIMSELDDNYIKKVKREVWQL